VHRIASKPLTHQARISQLNNWATGVGRQSDQLKADLTRTAAENTQLAHRLRIAEARVGQLEEANKHLATAKAAGDAAAVSLAVAEKERKSLQADKKRLTADLEALNGALMAAQAQAGKARALETELASAKNAIAGLRTMADDARKLRLEKTAAAARVDELVKQRDGAVAQYEAMVRNDLSTQSTLKTLRTELAAATAAREEAVEKLAYTIKAHGALEAGLRRQVDLSKTAQTDAQTAQTALAQRLKVAEGEARTAKKELAQLHDDWTTLSTAWRDLDDKLRTQADVADDLKVAEAELAKLRSSQAYLDRELKLATASKQTELAALQTQHDKALADVRASRSAALAEATREFESMQASHKAALAAHARQASTCVFPPVLALTFAAMPSRWSDEHSTSSVPSTPRRSPSSSERTTRPSPSGRPSTSGPRRRSSSRSSSCAGRSTVRFDPLRSTDAAASSRPPSRGVIRSPSPQQPAAATPPSPVSPSSTSSDPRVNLRERLDRVMAERRALSASTTKSP